MNKPLSSCKLKIPGLRQGKKKEHFKLWEVPAWESLALPLVHHLHQLSSTVNPEIVGCDKLTTQAVPISSTFPYQYSAWGKRESAIHTFLFTPSQRLGGEVREKKTNEKNTHKLIYTAALHQLKSNTDPIFLQPYHTALNNLCHSQAQTGNSAGNTSPKGPCFLLILSTLGGQGPNSNLWSFQGYIKSHLQ